MRWIVGSGRALVAAAVFTLLFMGEAPAQGVTTGAITGKVTDPQGQPVAEAAVQVTNRGSGFTTTGRTRGNGQYLIQGLEVGGIKCLLERGMQTCKLGGRATVGFDVRGERIPSHPFGFVSLPHPIVSRT